MGTQSINSDFVEEKTTAAAPVRSVSTIPSNQEKTVSYGDDFISSTQNPTELLDSKTAPVITKTEVLEEDTEHVIKTEPEIDTEPAVVQTGSTLSITESGDDVNVIESVQEITNDIQPVTAKTNSTTSLLS